MSASQKRKKKNRCGHAYDVRKRKHESCECVLRTLMGQRLMDLPVNNVVYQSLV